MTDKISISGLDKVVLLRALWDKSKIASFFQYHPMIPIPIWNEEEAHKALRSYIDYFQGRVIKTDLTGDIANSNGYDRDNGDGAFASVVETLR